MMPVGLHLKIFVSTGAQHKYSIMSSYRWLALVIGNSHLHWAWFIGEKLQSAWDTPHLQASAIQQLANCQNLADFPKEILPPITRSPLYLASVVPSQTEIWQTYPDVRIITLEQVPIARMYPTLGIDRALALYGAGETLGYPVLVIDAGTALTFTGAKRDRTMVGGAILPGLSLQLHSLAQKTALPQLETQNVLSLPERWALNTPESIYSGILYTILAGIGEFIEDWLHKFPESCIYLTGGDGKRLLAYMRSHSPQLATKVIFEPHLIFWGMGLIKGEG